VKGKVHEIEMQNHHSKKNSNDHMSWGSRKNLGHNLTNTNCVGVLLYISFDDKNIYWFNP